MSIKRYFFPAGENRSVVWTPVEKGRTDLFRDFSLGAGLGRLIMTSCHEEDFGGEVSLFGSSVKIIETAGLVIPTLEVVDAELTITLDFGEECELDVQTADQGEGTVLFRHDPISPVIPLMESYL